MVLDDQLRTYDLEHLLSIFDNLHDLNTIFESNPLLDHAYFKCTLLMYQQLLDQAKGEVRAKQNQVDTGITDVFYELLTNLHLTEQIEEWNRIQKYLFAYMGEGQDARIRISEYAEMLSFMSINMDVRKHGQMLSVGRDLLNAFKRCDKSSWFVGTQTGDRDVSAGFSGFRRKTYLRVCVTPQSDLRETGHRGGSSDDAGT